MTATTANLSPQGQSIDVLRAYPVLASTSIYEGSLVFIDATTGYASGDDEAGVNQFVGVAEAEADNSSGSSGDIKVKVWTKGNYRHLTFTGTAVQTSVGLGCYAVDNQTIQTTATNATFIGYVTEFIDATTVAVDIQTLADKPN